MLKHQITEGEVRRVIRKASEVHASHAQPQNIPGLRVNLPRALKHFGWKIEGQHTVISPCKTTRHSSGAAPQFHHDLASRRHAATLQNWRNKPTVIFFAGCKERCKVPFFPPRSNVMKRVFPATIVPFPPHC